MRMLDLPDGTVLFSASATQLYVYRPGGSPLAAGKPVIGTITQNADGSFHATGTLFNGISAGAAYGDDAQMDSNYPLVRMTNSTSGSVYYARTYNWSSTSVMTGNEPVTTEFALPVGLPSDNYSLVVAANGISSDPVSFSTLALPPVVVTQPQNQTVTAGVNVTFAVAAAGTPLSYFWLQNGSFIAGATSSGFTTNSVQLSGSGTQFSCLVSNAFGTTLSSNAVLTVVPGFPPGITSQPGSQTVPTGGSATFSLSATSSVPISYFWKRNGAYIAGATTSSYTTNNVQPADSGAQFSCLVSNTFGTILSSNAVLTVVAGPSNDLCAGAIVVAAASYTNTQSTALATSTGDPSPSCIGGFGKGVWYAYTPATSGTLVVDTIGSGFDTGLGLYTGTCGSLAQVACDDDGGGNLTSRITNSVAAGTTYYILAGGYNGASGNLVFHLNFNAASPAPSITVQPVSQSVGVNASATFSVTATGAAPLSYYWRRNGVPIAGATASSYTTNNVQVSDSGSQFSCLVSNAYGTVLSSNGVLTVSALLVQNGGFESGSFSFWTSSGNFVSSSVTTASGYVHSGTYGAQLGPAGSLGYISQTLPTAAGQSYLVSCWLYCGGETPNEFLVAWNGANLFDQANLGATGWTNIQLIATAPAPGTVLAIGFRNDPAYLGLDDIAVTPITAPVFQFVSQAGGIITFSWSAVPGLAYQVQYRTNLTQPDWINLGSATTAISGALSASDTVGPDPQRYYRVVLSQ